MNLKDLNVDSFLKDITKFAEEKRAEFSRELERRVDELSRGAKDVADWAAGTKVQELLNSILTKEATVFTATIPRPSGYATSESERDVRLDFNGYGFTLGRVKNPNTFYGARVVLVVIPQDTLK